MKTRYFYEVMKRHSYGVCWEIIIAIFLYNIIEIMSNVCRIVTEPEISFLQKIKEIAFTNVILCGTFTAFSFFVFFIHANKREIQMWDSTHRKVNVPKSKFAKILKICSYSILKSANSVLLGTMLITSLFAMLHSLIWRAGISGEEYARKITNITTFMCGLSVQISFIGVLICPKLMIMLAENEEKCETEKQKKGG